MFGEEADRVTVNFRFSLCARSHRENRKFTCQGGCGPGRHADGGLAPGRPLSCVPFTATPNPNALEIPFGEAQLCSPDFFEIFSRPPLAFRQS